MSALQRVKFNLEEMTKKNSTDSLILTTEGYAIEAVFVMVKKVNMLLAMPDLVRVQFTEYERVHTHFPIDQSHKAILLAAIQKFFTTLDDKHTPAFLTSVEMNFDIGRFLEVKLSKSVNQSSASDLRRKNTFL